MQTEKDYYKEEFKKVFDEYLKVEKEYHDYVGQFITEALNGKVIRKATKTWTLEEGEKIKKMREKVEKTREKLAEAEKKWLSINS